MLRRLVFAALALPMLGAAACSSSKAPAGGADAAAADDGGSEAAACSGPMQPGPTLCNGVLSALCARRVTCAAGSASCPDCASCTAGSCASTTTGFCTGTSAPSCTQQSCTQSMALYPSFDCTQPAFAKSGCSDLATACEKDVATIACADSLANTWNWPASCSSFWAQF